MKLILVLAGFWVGIAQSQSILPVTGTVEFSTTATATGTASATLVPFNLDLTGQPDFRNPGVLQKSLTSTWESRVSIYDDVDKFVSFVSLQWPRGEGPGAPPIADGKPWGACVIAIPDLFSQLGLKNPGNGSCVDVMHPDCLANMEDYVVRTWDALIRVERPFSVASAARVCGGFETLPLAPVCFGDLAQNGSEIQAYPRHNPLNGQPFFLGVDEYGTGKDDKSTADAKARSRAWPLLILEAEQKTAVWSTTTCPSARSGSFYDGFDSGSFSKWKMYGGGLDASSKALLVKSSSGGKALIEGYSFDDFTYDTDIQFPEGTTGGNGGIIFRVSDPSEGTNSYRGYYAGLDAERNKVIFGVANYGWTETRSVDFKVKGGGKWHMRVCAQADTISIFVDDMHTAKITLQDATYAKGSAGVRNWYADTIFDNVDIKPIHQTKPTPSPDGTCGGMSQYSCSNTSVFFGNCCGADGLCGYSKESCGDRCQPKYGLCDTIVTVTASDTPTGTSTSPASTSASTSQPTATSGWNMMGCYKDLYSSTKRTLNDQKSLQDPLTIDSCRTQCFLEQYKYSGVENGNECWCGNEIQDSSSNIPVSMSECSIKCPGDAKQSCGAGGRIVLSQYVAPATSTWTTIGCYKDLYPSKDRTLQEPQIFMSQLTQQGCRDACAAKQYKYSGLEKGSECWCGDAIQSAIENTRVPLTECSKACPGNVAEKCGADGRILISQLTLGSTPGWEEVGCHKDTFASHARTLKDLVASDGDLTLEKCQSLCLARGYTYSGMENGGECWCGNDIQSAASNTLTVLSECGKGCPGNSKQLCGNGGRINISRYYNPSRLIWRSMGCYRDTTQPRVLAERFDVGASTTPQNCRSVCLNRGFGFAGVENGSECWCGNQIQAPLDSWVVDMANCNKPCSGDNQQDCGSGGFIHIFRLRSA